VSPPEKFNLSNRYLNTYLNKYYRKCLR